MAGGARGGVVEGEQGHVWVVRGLGWGCVWGDFHGCGACFGLVVVDGWREDVEGQTAHNRPMFMCVDFLRGRSPLQ